MQQKVTIDPGLFEAISDIDIDRLAGHDLSSVLPYLGSLLMSPTFAKKPNLIRLIHPIRKMNDVMRLISIRCFDHIEPNINPNISFESSSYLDRINIVAIEYLRIQTIARSPKQPTGNASHVDTQLISSDLFDNPIYIDDISFCLCTLLMKSSNLPMMNILDMSETLLHVSFGVTYIIRLVANMPDRCNEVCQALIASGDYIDEGVGLNEVSDQRAKVLRKLCEMNPSLAITLRSITLQSCSMPSLTIMITHDNLSKALNNYNQLVEKHKSSEQMEIDNGTDICEAYADLEDCFDSTVAFITGIFLGADESTKSWFSQYVRSSQLKKVDQGHYSVLTSLRSLFLDCIGVLFPNIHDDKDTFMNLVSDEASSKKTKENMRKLNKQVIRPTALLRLYCVLRGIGSLKLNPDEVEVLMKIITSKLAIVNPSAINFATTGVCTLLVCSTIISNQKDEKRAADWLRWLIRDSSFGEGNLYGNNKCSLSEILLLVAIHFLNNQTNQIVDLVCSTLGMKLQIKASVVKCRTLFVQEVFNDQMVAEHAVKVPVTVNLNNNMTEFLPVHCIHQLLESRSFSKHQISIHNWIFKQLCQSTKPLHHMIPKLIEAYVNSVIVSTNAHGHCGTNQCLSEEDISKVFEIQLYSDATRVPLGMKFSHDQLNGLEVADPEVSQVALLYYLLLYEELRIRKYPDLGPERSKLIRYSQDFMMEIPIFYLVQIARDNQDSFGPIFPDLVRLISLQYPQLCSIQHWLTLESNESDFWKWNTVQESKNGLQSKVIGKNSLSTNEIKDQLIDRISKLSETDNSSIRALTRSIDQILFLNKEEIWPFVKPFIDSLPKLIKLENDDNIESKDLLQAVSKLWWKFNNIFPRKLWVLTVNALRKHQNSENLNQTDLEPVEYSCDELVTDPLIILRCDKKVYRSVNMLNIVLHILNAFLAASKRSLHDQISEQIKQKESRGLEELRVTLMHAQTSAAIQILLESCIPNESEQACIVKQEHCVKLSSDEQHIINRLDASINCICEHLHQVFIADINLAKLVHFQTYPSELLSITADRIPSMHICLDFIPELIGQPDLDKQIFVIELTSYLCKKYAITKSLNMAKLCFNVSFTMLQLLPSERRALFFIPVLPALLRICEVFPILKEDASVILNQINHITQAHLASTSSHFSLGATRPFEGLEELNWRDAKKLMSELGLNEALYMCTNKCLMDLDKLKPYQLPCEGQINWQWVMMER